MTGTIILIVILLIAALLLFAAEICTPTFGVLAVAGVACLAWMVYLCFGLDPLVGVGSLIALIFIIPAWLWASVKYLIPRTFVGRVLQLRPRRADPGEGTPEAEAQKPLVGRRAVAETSLRPSGAIRIDGRRVIATAEAGYIEKGEKVRVIKATGMNVIVQKME